MKKGAKYGFLLAVVSLALVGIFITTSCVAPARTPASPTAPAKPTYQYEWKLAQVHPKGSDYDKRARAFADEVREKTDGRIDIKVYSGGVLGDWVTYFPRVMRGEYEMALTPIPPTYDPRLNVAYYMPYMFTTTKQAKKAYKKGGWVYNMVSDLLLDYNIKGLGIFPVGWSGVTLKEEPEGWRQMKKNGMKIRVMPLKACELTWARLGYTPSTIPYAEAYSAIERGVVVGEMGGPPYQGWQFRDIQGVWIQYNDYLEPWWFFMNLDLWKSLTKHDQKVLMEAAQKQIRGRWDYFLKEDKKYRRKLADYGLKVINPSKEVKDRFAKAVRKDVWPKLEKVMGKSVVDMCREHASPLGHTR